MVSNTDLEDSSASPAKRPRTLLALRGTLSPIVSSNKGKDKIEPNVCGICLSEDGKASRGWIDSCNHYFCFICIMEWSKVESRCPLCKQRFATIRRPPKDGVFLFERIVSVAVRDQICHPLGNATTEAHDPYAHVNCTLCQSSIDENLLLLCDLCDSAVHTYCVGLGRTVPEGDWYCQDCTISRNDYRNSENDVDSSQVAIIVNPKQVVGASVSISEVVQESYFLEVHQPPSDSSCPKQEPSSPVSDNGSCSITKSLDLNVRTLHRCRNVQSQIRSLRENWNALRSGSLNFYSSLPYPGDKIEENNRPLSSNSSRSQLLANNGFSTKENIEESSCSILNRKNSYDTKKAWKMMKMARSIQNVSDGTKINHKQGKINVPLVSPNLSLSCFALEGKLCKEKGLGGLQSEKYGYNNIKVAHDLHNKNFSKGSVNENSKIFCRSPNIDVPGLFVCPSPGQVHTFPLKDTSHRGGSNLTMEGMDKSDLNSYGCEEPKFLGSPTYLSAAASDLSFRILEGSKSSGCRMKLPKEKNRGKKTLSEAGSRNDYGAKSEVQSLVKLNLKLLSKDEKLDKNEFKAIARLATHSILMACGLESTRPCSFIPPKLICKHSGQNHLSHMSNLLPSSCRECFFIFVKDVVFSLMTERVSYSHQTTQVRI
ncbi:hypothetical protein Sjap_015368 [Stephania japonica]|uniref:PHD and RING finger domain-containing protein 1 n=1 Tax=Stephania japonica TaxID=461633 RepID=A0AAP0IJ00_9MAGN